jgi:RNA polymerase sigma-70 factor (ECF subfamily)
VSLAGAAVSQPSAVRATAPAELDALTLARARRGDPDAFRALVERYAASVHALLYRMVEARLGAARVDDLAQDTFVRLHGALPRFDPSGPARLSTYILTIATRLALNALRDERPTEPLAAVADLPASDRTDLALERARLRRAVAGLTAEHRAVVLLRDVHDLGYDEIARALDLAPGTVRSRLHRARAELRRLLEADHA